jgi:hypothetical protein
MKKILFVLFIVLLSLTCTMTAYSASTTLPQFSTSTIEPAYSYAGNLSDLDVDYWWIPNVSKDEIVLMSIVPDSGVWYVSSLSYSNLTEFQSTWAYGTHNHDFVADKTDTYLLKIYANGGALNFTIKHSARACLIRFSVEPNPAFVGETVTLLGNLTTHEGAPIPNVLVKILLNGQFVASLTTNATGWFRAAGKVGSPGTFTIKVCYGDSCCASQELIVNKTPTWVYAIFIPNPANVGDNCELRGILIDQFSNPIRLATLTLSYSTDNGNTWHPAGSLITNNLGVFSQAFKAPPIGTYLVRISYAGSQSYSSSKADILLKTR